MANTDERRYVQAYARIIGVREEAALDYAQRKGITALVDNAAQLLSTPAQREKHQAFLDLYRMSSAINTQKPQLNSPEKAAEFFHSIMDQIHDKEAFVVAFLNTKNRVIDHEIVSLGTINASLVHPREVFRNAIINKANAVIVGHNHPSGEVYPSSEDKALTARLKEAGDLMGIPVLDHVIVTGVNRDAVYSFKKDGVMEAGSDYRAASAATRNPSAGTPEAPDEPHQEHIAVAIPDDTYAIYQLKPEENLRFHRFESLDRLQNDGLAVEFENYQCVYTGSLSDFDGTDRILDALFERFNLDHPADFKGHSLSVSDVILLNRSGATTAHYVDSFGFEVVPEFLNRPNPLRSIEDALEQNDNQLDGVLNNLPSMDAREPDAAPLSKERPSIVAQLKVFNDKQEPLKQKLPRDADGMDR